MKIKREDISKFLKIFRDIPYNPIGDKSNLIVFPLDMTKVVENDGFEISIQPTTTVGVAKDPEPVLVLSVGDSDRGDRYTHGVLGYADLTYGRKFSIQDFVELIGSKVTKGIRELESYECMLLAPEYLLAKFEF